MSFAVIKTGGKQYKVVEGGKVLVEKLNFSIGEEFDIKEVLLVGNGKVENLKIGTPLVEGASVRARVLDYGRAKKKIIFKFKNKTRYWKKKGHRQPYTKVEILKIVS